MRQRAQAQYFDDRMVDVRTDGGRAIQSAAKRSAVQLAGVHEMKGGNQMGYMFCTGPCVNCKKLFTFNPDLVPSTRVNGIKEPICKDCVEWANPIRKERGLEPIPVLRGAYELQECA